MMHGLTKPEFKKKLIFEVAQDSVTLRSI